MVDPNGQVLDGATFWAPPESVHYLSPNNSRWPALKFRNAAKWSAITAAGFSTLAIFQKLPDESRTHCRSSISDLAFKWLMARWPSYRVD